MSSRPPIVISTLDAQRLEHLLDSLPSDAFPGREELESELARAELVTPREVPPSSTSTTHSTTFTDRLRIV